LVAEPADFVGKTLLIDFISPVNGRVLLAAGAKVTVGHFKSFEAVGLLELLGECLKARPHLTDLDGFEIEVPALPEVFAQIQDEISQLPARTKVLVIDDAIVMRAILEKMFTKAGFECFQAASAREALEQFVLMRPDVVTLDITMPEVDGFSALLALRQLDPDVKVVMCTASGHEETMETARLHGAVGFLSKPITYTALANAMGALGFPFADPTVAVAGTAHD
jgi:two-component system chemotaxis response regulator CheY